MPSNIVYTLDDSFAPCLIYLNRIDPCTGATIPLAINLDGATVRTVTGGFHINGRSSGAYVSDTSPFNITDIQTLIQQCHASTGGGGGAATSVSINNPLDPAVDVDGTNIADTGLQVVLKGVNTVKPVASAGTVTPSLRESSSAGTTVANAYQISISNVGVASGVVDGVTFPVGASVEYTAHHDLITGEYKLLNPLNFNGTGTILLVSEVVRK